MKVGVTLLNVVLMITHNDLLNTVSEMVAFQVILLAIFCKISYLIIRILLMRQTKIRPTVPRSLVCRSSFFGQKKRLLKRRLFGSD